MHQWIEVFNTNDLRHILKEYDKNIPTEELMPYFDTLMAEYDSLNDSDEYAMHLEKMDDKLYKAFIIKVCALTITSIKWGLKEDAEGLIKDFKLKVNIDDKEIVDKAAIEKLEKKIKQINTTIEVTAIQEAEESQGNKKTVWEDLIVYIDQAVGTKIDYNCPVALYLSYKKQAQAIQTARKKK